MLKMCIVGVGFKSGPRAEATFQMNQKKKKKRGGGNILAVFFSLAAAAVPPFLPCIPAWIFPGSCNVHIANAEFTARSLSAFAMRGQKKDFFFFFF